MKLSEIEGHPTIDETIEFIKQAHNGQKYGSKPYWTHPYNVMMLLPAGSSDDAKHAALMHDVIEDTSYTAQDLLSMGYSNNIVTIVELLTKPDGADYFDYVVNTIIGSGNKDAMRVKFADNKSNHDAPGDGMAPERKARLVKKYAKSMELLQKAF